MTNIKFLLYLKYMSMFGPIYSATFHCNNKQVHLCDIKRYYAHARKT